MKRAAIDLVNAERPEGDRPPKPAPSKPVPETPWLGSATSEVIAYRTRAERAEARALQAERDKVIAEGKLMVVRERLESLWRVVRDHGEETGR